MQVERLRLAGFKSFVEPAELVIEPGLTGIVGPNGCGKSNLVEALRWVMGEASARRLRGGEMDDVIFGGSADRPARNLAEVTLTLDNAARDAPFAVNESSTIEIARRIVRGSGSIFRINGREARARDVQLLFADAASGPHSGAMVGQGRVGALLGAKPGERRSLVDEAAGTAGLHARRHEAELRLRGAEENLARLDDVVVTLKTQAETLRKQLRQATRYRRLGEQIRRAEAQLMHLRWRAAAAEADALAANLRAAERDLAAAVASVSAREKSRVAAEVALPALRAAQAAATAAAQRVDHARSMLEQELQRAVAARADVQERLRQASTDLEREQEQSGEANEALQRLASARQTLERARAADAAARAAAEANVADANAGVTTAEAGLQQMVEVNAAATARRDTLERQRRDADARRAAVAVRLEEGKRQRDSVATAMVSADAIEQAAAVVATAVADIGRLRTTAKTMTEALEASRQREGGAVDAARDAARALAELRAEAEGLRRVLTPANDPANDKAPHSQSMLAQLKVTPGFEAATAALFDGALAAPLLTCATGSSHRNTSGWVELPALPASPLPAGAHGFSDAIAGPPALARRLAHAGWIENHADGCRLQAQLTPGQSLVDRDGRLWRWDGFVSASTDTTETAERLRQRNRLEQLTAKLATITAAARDASEAAEQARAARQDAARAEQQAIGDLRSAETHLSATRDREAELSRRNLGAEARLSAIDDAMGKLGSELAELGKTIDETSRATALLPSPELAPSALEAARVAAAVARRRESEARAALEQVVRAAASRAARLAALAREEETWQRQRDRSGAHRSTLSERRDALETQLTEIAARPAAIAVESAELAQQSFAAAAELSAAEDRLAVAERALRVATEAARQAESAVSQARESRAGISARCEAAADTVGKLRNEIAAYFGDTPENLAAAVRDTGGEAADDADGLAARLDRLQRERDGMGPVNLLAEQETAEVEVRISDLERERGDLTAAIARLRRGIATLDQEGRRRLVAAFEQLNRHFGELFVRLFGGGRAELTWADDGDPLTAGLDILASPPGKRLDSLSLLSGGEQALTALALLFAVFVTNPAPLCVLDEADAPLDDANVDAFCRLVSEIADATGTRFLLITHHRVTMARMDRLFGVTMAERGVSQLVSVDLSRAVELRQSA